MSAGLTASIATRFGAVTGNPYVLTEACDLEKYSVDGVVPSAAVQPEDAAQAAEIVRIAAEDNLCVIACGARTTLGLGMPPVRYDVALDMTRVSGIAHYDAGDLTIGVKAGTSLKEVARVLAEKNQFLPFAVPFYDQATVGGAIAAGLDSPLRHGYGTVRDFLIGAEFVDGTGASARSGGCVVKNVTGYDFHKLLIGSLGSLGVITRINFRTFPLPPVRRGFLASFNDENGAFGFMRSLASSSLTPAVLEVLSPEFVEMFVEQKTPVASLRLNADAWTVCVGFEGSSAYCDRHSRDLTELARKGSAQNAVALNDSVYLALLEILRETPAAMSRATPQAVVFRFATVPGKTADLLRALRSFANSSWMPSATLVRSGSIIDLALLPREGDETALKQIAYFWKSAGSLRTELELQASILFCPAAWKSELDVWAYVSGAMDMERRVKSAFDPNGTFARGRFVGGL